ncbi:MAG: ferritin [Candidatus Cloacimonetes bacterium]|nr:ferritin [Candidatus Cloacimonadota bacterium]MDD4154999.1 ferritin [Candidatus Cloacimonadota bacterium]
MKINDKLSKELNEQITKEFYSEYLYLAMAVHFEDLNLEGFANWMYKQATEEHEHGMKILKYLVERGSSVKIDKIDEPKFDKSSIKGIFEQALKHEQFVTKSIDNLMDIAIETNDHPTKNFLIWFVDEQVEEESSVEKIINYLDMIGDKGNGLFMLDRELSKR